MKKKYLWGLILLIIALSLFVLVYFIQSGFPLKVDEIVKIIGTSMLIVSLSFFSETFLFNKLFSKDAEVINTIEKFEISDIDYRNHQESMNISPPINLIKKVKKELTFIGYSLDNTIQNFLPIFIELLNKGVIINFLILDETSDQSLETEKRDISNGVSNALEALKTIEASRLNQINVKKYSGHFYYTGIFIDRKINIDFRKSEGEVRIQFKGNYKTQHEGLIMQLKSSSIVADYYTDSCKKIWESQKTKDVRL